MPQWIPSSPWARHGPRWMWLGQMKVKSYPWLTVTSVSPSRFPNIQSSAYRCDLDLTFQGQFKELEMAAKERAYMISYPLSIVTITRFCTVFKIQSSKDQWVTDLTSPGHFRSKPMAPFERASMTSYSTLMVTIDLSASVSKLQPSEICLKYAWPRFDLERTL